MVSVTWLASHPPTVRRGPPFALLECASTEKPMSDIAIVVNTAVAILAVVVLIVRFKFNPVVSLVLGSLYLGLATKLGIDKTVETVATGFGDIMAEVGLLIAFGVLMG